MNNVYGYRTFSFDTKNFGEELNLLISFFQEIDTNIGGFRFEEFIRFVIINVVQSGVYTNEQLLIKKVLYQQHGEFIIQNYLNFYLMSDRNILDYTYFIHGMGEFDNLDLYYISYKK